MKKQFTAEEKKVYYAEQKKKIEQSLIDGVNFCFTEGNFKKYLDTLGKFHDYSIRNCMLIVSQCPEASFVAGYTDWKKKFNRHVKAGEKAIGIIAPAPCKYTVKDVDRDGNEVEKQIEFNRYKVVPVFDISQTEGEELPTICKELTDEVQNFDEIRSSLEKVASVPVTYEDFDDDAHGFFSVQENKIVVKAGMPEAQTVKTLVHEIAHSILHNDVFCEIPKQVKEVQAESVAYLVCAQLGINTAQYSFEYIASWAKEDPKEINAQMEIVRKTADAILSKMN